MKAKSYFGICAAAAAFATLPGSASAIEIDTNKWFAYYQQPPLGRGMVDVTTLLSKQKCEATGRDDKGSMKGWSSAAIYYGGARKTPHCWKEINPGLILVCQLYRHSSGQVFMSGSCEPQRVENYTSTNSLPKRAF